MNKLVFFSILFIAQISSAQIGGDYAFPFLNLTYNARAAGLGNQFVTAKDNDINAIINSFKWLIGIKISDLFFCKDKFVYSFKYK